MKVDSKKIKQNDTNQKLAERKTRCNLAIVFLILGVLGSLAQWKLIQLKTTLGFYSVKLLQATALLSFIYLLINKTKGNKTQKHTAVYKQSSKSNQKSTQFNKKKLNKKIEKANQKLVVPNKEKINIEISPAQKELTPSEKHSRRTNIKKAIAYPQISAKNSLNRNLPLYFIKVSILLIAIITIVMSILFKKD